MDEDSRAYSEAETPKKNSKPAKNKQPRKKRASGLDAVEQQLNKTSEQLRKHSGEAFANGNRDRAEKLLECAEKLTTMALDVGKA